MAITNTWAFQRSFLIRTYNQEVKEYFRDVPDTDEATNTTSRGAAKSACLIDANDSRIEAYMKMHTFNYVVRRVQDKPDVYGIPIEDYEEEMPFSPVVHLYFQQDAQAVPAGKKPVRRQISFRLPNETTKTILPAEANRLALKVKNEFASNNGYRFDTGKIKATYKYHPKFQRVMALVRNESDGQEVIRKILSVLDLTYDETKLTFNIPRRESITNPVGRELIFGKQRDKPRWRPIAVVRFTHASLHVQGVRQGTILVDRSARYINALQRA